MNRTGLCASSGAPHWAAPSKAFGRGCVAGTAERGTLGAPGLVPGREAGTPQEYVAPACPRPEGQGRLTQTAPNLRPRTAGPASGKEG